MERCTYGGQSCLQTCRLSAEPWGGEAQRVGRGIKEKLRSAQIRTETCDHTQHTHSTHTWLTHPAFIPLHLGHKHPYCEMCSKKNKKPFTFNTDDVRRHASCALLINV